MQGEKLFFADARQNAIRPEHHQPGALPPSNPGSSRIYGPLRGGT